MKTLNEIILQGRICKDPSIGENANGKEYGMVSVATETITKNPEGEFEAHESVHMVFVWDMRHLVLLKRYAKKGAYIQLKGSLRYMDTSSVPQPACVHVGYRDWLYVLPIGAKETPALEG